MFTYMYNKIIVIIRMCESAHPSSSLILTPEGIYNTTPGASFTKKDRTISLKMSVRSFLRSAYVGFTKTS